MTLDKERKTLERLSNTFDGLVERTIDTVSLQHKTLKEALTSQLPLQLELEMLVKRLHYLHDNVELEVDEAYAIAIATQMKNSYRDITYTQAKDYAKADPEYKSAKKFLYDVRKVRDEAKGCLEVVNTRRYTLNNMTNAIVAGVENSIL